jgi:sRNA-binding regulator protein Hfq
MNTINNITLTEQKKGTTNPTHMNNVQSKFFKQAVYDKATLVFDLYDGQKVAGQIIAFDTYTLLIKVSDTKNILLFKTYIVKTEVL